MDSVFNDTDTILHWMCRDYESAEFWKATAKQFFVSAIVLQDWKTDSDFIRNKFTDFLKLLFYSFEPKETVIQKWVKESTIPQPHTVSKPVFETHLIEWDRIADYFLLSVHQTSPVIDDVNRITKVILESSKEADQKSLFDNDDRSDEALEERILFSRMEFLRNTGYKSVYYGSYKCTISSQ
ncbi:MAG: hypothetical protein ACRC2T_10360 [Thermoguttaceae bacterium]